MIPLRFFNLSRGFLTQKVRIVGLSHTILSSKKSLMVYWSSCGRDQTVCLEDRLVADVFGL